MKEVILAKRKPIVLEKVWLYIQSTAKGGPAKDDLETKKVELKSNQSAPPTAAMVAAPTASKPTVMMEKKMSRRFISH